MLDSLLLRAWHGGLELTELVAESDRLVARGQAPLAAVLYQTWLEHSHSPQRHLAHFNHGVLLYTLGEVAGAMRAYAQALHLAPDFAQPRFNLGLCHERLGQHEAAVAQWRWLELHLSPEHPEQRPLWLMALNNLGRHFEDRGQLGEALACLGRSLKEEPDQPDVVHHWVFLRAKQCVWPVYEAWGRLDTDTQRRHTSALAMISLSDDPAEQRRAAEAYVARKLPQPLPARRSRPLREQWDGRRPLKIAYCSGDFCLHPVAMLTAELMASHDRRRFEVHAYDWSPDDGSALRQRLLSGVDHVHRVRHDSDEAVTQRILDDGIDVLVDLQGQTLGARPGLLAPRPAPIQITYLGLPATTAWPFIDWVVADERVIPPEEAMHFTEKPLILPELYQVSDRLRVADPVPSRAEVGLPEQGCVLACFNNNHKMNPEGFAVWMRVLQRVPDSVLWLLADNPWAEAELRRQAQAAGLADGRLVFAPRTTPSAYLARYGLVDLFLDTYPFNGGTTANDALWMGAPVLTRRGRTFASRMASALLHAAGLNALVTSDWATYEAQAVTLASDRPRLAALRQQLLDEKKQGVLFDTPRWTRHFEDRLWALAQAERGG